MHERKFVVKCEGDSLTWNQYIAKLNKRKIWSNMAFCIATVWESGGTRPLCLPPNCAHDSMQADFLSVGLYLNTIVQKESARKMYV